MHFKCFCVIFHAALRNLLRKLVPSSFFVQQTSYFFTQTSYFLTQTSYFLTQTSYFFTQQITQCCVKNYAFQMFLRNAAYCGVVLRRIAILLNFALNDVETSFEYKNKSKNSYQYFKFWSYFDSFSPKK